MQEELQALIRNNTWLITYLPPGYGLTQSASDHSLFYKYSSSGSYFGVVIYVDDILVASSDDNIIFEFKFFLAEHFKFKDLGYPKYFLGIEIARNKSVIFISQHKYALDLVSDAGLLDHHVAAERVLKYLKGIVGHGLFYSAQVDLSLSIFSDADWAGCPDTIRSISGFCLFLGDGFFRGVAVRRLTDEERSQTLVRISFPPGTVTDWNLLPSLPTSHRRSFAIRRRGRKGETK
ncbi:hypothetical protein SASPL_129925 [Salvia splendens]|uniref:Reverse transcriptase Ty1/copia-type domain-containing protein n=1 Tax=Salvia splendens TaxID=180675 RepID=A0A8X8XI49_SALSN|nr:hypothetical protein SASPL_129925 [Salvia splendens]